MKIFYELTHTSCDVEIMKSGFDFHAYHLSPPGKPDWDESGRPRPDNVTITDKVTCRYDLAVVGTEHVLRQLPLGMPIIWKCLSDWGKHEFPDVVLERTTAFVFPCEETVDRWGMRDDPRSHVIEHGIDGDIFCEYEGNIEKTLTVGNLITLRPEKGPDVQLEVEKHVSVDTVGVGNDGVANDFGPARSVWDLADRYRQYRVYFNPSTVVVCAVLEAMAAGMPVVTMTPGNFVELMQDRVNCFIADTPSRAVHYIELLMRNPKLGRDIGQKARKSVYHRFHPQICADKWRKLIRKCVSDKKKSMFAPSYTY